MNKIIRLSGTVAIAVLCIGGGVLMNSNKLWDTNLVVNASEYKDIENSLTDSNSDETVSGAMEDEIYCLASVSKVYVTTAIMQLADQGKVDIDAPVTDYIDDFEMADERYKDITVRMLMNHTSGIMGSTFKDEDLLADNQVDYSENVLSNLKTQRLKADPGEYASYCNDGFTLLEILVERVSGMSYTEYVEKNISQELGLENTKTAKTISAGDNITTVYDSQDHRYDYEYGMALGSGGMYSTAAETCEFGSTFWTGDNRLLKESTKNEMATAWTDDEVKDKYGLGWDYVEELQYEKAGVKVVGKGGDLTEMHSELLVAPEEEISVCVVSSGGSSSYNKRMAESLMNIALEEKGKTIDEITVDDVAPDGVNLLSEVPEEYADYAGYYTLGSSGIIEISFPDMKYMKVTNITGDTTNDSFYMYTGDGFVKVSGDVEEGSAVMASQYVKNTFEKSSNGSIYIIQEGISSDYGLEKNYYKQYVAEKMEINPVSNEVESVLQTGKGMYALINHKYSSEVYDMPFVSINCIDGTGYVYCGSPISSFCLKIKDANHYESFSTIPSTSNRDLADVYVGDDGIIHDSMGDDYISLDEAENFTESVKEIKTKSNEAQWYKIDSSVAGKTINLDRPENSAVYVYDKFGEVVYSSHMLDYGKDIPLVMDGYIMFAGEDGGKIDITFAE